jgi:MFS family permease
VLPPWHPPKVAGPPLEEIRRGLVFVARERPIRALLELVTVFSVLGIPYIALMPVMARDQLGLGASGYGLLLTALGIGGLTGALALAAIGPRVRRGALFTVTSFGYAGLLLVLSLVRTPALAYPVLLLTGFLMIVTNAVANGLLQTLVPDELRGRLMSIYSLIVVGLPQVVGAFAAGAVARLFGVQWAVGGAAAIMLMFGAVAYRWYPEVRGL